MLRSIPRLFGRPTPTTARRDARSRSLDVEVLEGRELPAGMGLLVPAYIYPEAGAWAPLTSAAAQVPVMAIINPNSGPGVGATYERGGAVHGDYTSAVDSLRAAGGKVIGYVHTRVYPDNATVLRPLADVKAEINAYRDRYAIDGIFVDEMSNDAGSASVGYYKSIYDYAHSIRPSWTVVGNPGSVTPESYVATPVADTLVLFERESGYDTYTAPAWQSKYAAGRFADLVINVASAAQMQTAVSRAASQNTGWVYVTDDRVATDPWNTLPSYFNQLVTAVAAGTPRPATPALTIATSTLAGHTANAAGYNQTIVAAGGTGARSFTYTGALPSGLNLNAQTGVISGMPVAAGTFSFTVVAKDTAGAVASRAFSIAVQPPLALTTTVLAAGTVNRNDYNQTIAVSGGTGAKTFQLTGSLPSGLTLNAQTGAITGMPLTASTYTFTVKATDTVGAVASRTYSILVNPAAPIAPPAPTNLKATPLSGTQIKLTWTDGAGETGYRVQFWSDGAWKVIATLGANTTTFTHTGLSAGVEYFYRIEAFNAVGSALMAGWVSVKTPVPTLTAVPRTGGGIQLTWSPAAGAVAYRVYKWDGAKAVQIGTLGAGATAFADLNVKSRTTYFYFLEAVDNTGAARSAWMSVMAP